MAADQARRVIWAEAAVADLEELVTYIAQDSPVHATRLMSSLRSKAASLAVNPRRGRVVPELGRFGMRTWRELIVRPYRVIYRLTNDTVTVLAVFDGRRDLEDVLLERLLRND